MSLRNLFLALFVGACVWADYSPALAAGNQPVMPEDITEVCLLDGVGNGTQGMQNCLIEAFPGDGGTISSSPYDIHYPNYPHFKASRWRISDYADVQSMINIPENQLQDGRGLYDFSTRTYFRPTFFRTSHPAAAMAGIRVNANVTASTPVDAFGMCRYIRNETGNDIFVPLRSFEEWKSFVDNSPSGVYLDRCSLPCPGDCKYYYGPTSANFKAGDVHNNDPTGSNSNYFSIELPYAREGTSWPTPQSDGILNVHTFKYKCYDMTVVGDTNHCIQPVGCAGGSCCTKYASKCVPKWHEWEEIWKINPLVAGASEDGDPSGQTPRTHKGWIFSDPMTSRIGGQTRPIECIEDLEHDFTEENDECAYHAPIIPVPVTPPPPPPPSVCGW